MRSRELFATYYGPVPTVTKKTRTKVICDEAGARVFVTEIETSQANSGWHLPKSQTHQYLRHRQYHRIRNSQ